MLQGRRQRMWSWEEFVVALEKAEHPFDGTVDYGGDSLPPIRVMSKVEDLTVAQQQAMWHAIEEGRDVDKAITDPFVRFPKGAEWGERMRFAGYEPTLYNRSSNAKVYVKRREDVGNYDVDVYKRLLTIMEGDKGLESEARAYLVATGGVTKTRQKKKRRKKVRGVAQGRRGQSLLSGKKRSDEERSKRRQGITRDRKQGFLL